MKLVKKGNQVKTETPKSKVWKPEREDTYYVVNSCGYIEEHTLYDDSNYAKEIYEFGNCYKTVEDAEFVVEKRKVEVELQRFADEHNEEGFDIFDINCQKYRIVYLSYGNYLSVDYDVNFVVGHTVYFSSEELANQAIDTIGEDRIKKCFFGIK